jgi:hypothetical protein
MPRQQKRDSVLNRSRVPIFGVRRFRTAFGRWESFHAILNQASPDFVTRYLKYWMQDDRNRPAN